MSKAKKKKTTPPYDKETTAKAVKTKKNKYARYPGGRPTEYKGEETIREVYEYLDTCGPTTREGLPWYKIPSVQGLTLYIGHSLSTIQDWEKKHQEFRVALNDVRQAQHEDLTAGGLSKALDSPITRLMLSNHGYADRKDVTTNGESLNDVRNELLDKIYDPKRSQSKGSKGGSKSQSDKDTDTAK